MHPLAHAWFDETHISVAKAAGYSKWFNACGPDMIKVKMGDRERPDHYVNNPLGTAVTPGTVTGQVGKYGEYHMAFCAHYVADLSMVLGYRLEDESRLLTKNEAYRRLGHSASLLKAVFEYAKD